MDNTYAPARRINLCPHRDTIPACGYSASGTVSVIEPALQDYSGSASPGVECWLNPNVFTPDLELNMKCQKPESLTASKVRRELVNLIVA